MSDSGSTAHEVLPLCLVPPSLGVVNDGEGGDAASQCGSSVTLGTTESEDSLGLVQDPSEVDVSAFLLSSPVHGGQCDATPPLHHN